VPHGIVKKLERSLQAPVDVLVERGVIPSAEVLATVAPQLTAQARSAGQDAWPVRWSSGAVSGVE
jgi:hypothetical protein